ncbi:MAG: hypothetical protein AMXMBFR33_36810 [Candidatus Xenobia bacterium]
MALPAPLLPLGHPVLATGIDALTASRRLDALELVRGPARAGGPPGPLQVDVQAGPGPTGCGQGGLGLAVGVDAHHQTLPIAASQLADPLRGDGLTGKLEIAPGGRRATSRQQPQCQSNA